MVAVENKMDRAKAKGISEGITCVETSKATLHTTPPKMSNKENANIELFFIFTETES